MTLVVSTLQRDWTSFPGEFPAINTFQRSESHKRSHKIDHLNIGMSPSYQEVARAPLCPPSDRTSQDGRSSSDLGKFDDDELEDGNIVPQTLRSRRTLSAAIVAPWILVTFCLISILYWHWKGPSDLECTRQLNPYCMCFTVQLLYALEH